MILLTGGKGTGDIRSGEERAQYTVDFTINPDFKAKPVKEDRTADEIAEGSGYTFAKGENDKYTFILTDSDGNGHKTETDEMPAIIQDKNGNTYEVDEKGEIKQVLSTNLSQLGYTATVLDSIYSFKIIREQTEMIYKPNSNVYISQNNNPITISLLKKNSIQNKEIPIKWVLASVLDTTPKLSVLCNINNIRNITVEAIDDSIKIPIIINIYKLPEIGFSVNNYDGSFGFDKYIGQYNPHINNTGQEDHQILVVNGTTQYIPNISLLPNQPNVRVTATFSNHVSMQKDSLFNHIKIYPSNEMVRLNNQDTIIINKSSMGIPVNFNITTNNATIKYDSILIFTNSGKCLSKLNVFSRDIIIKKILLVHVQNDSIGAASGLAVHTGSIVDLLNKKSFNQAFIQWSSDTLSITYNQIKNDTILYKYNKLLRKKVNSNIPIQIFPILELMIKHQGKDIANYDNVGFIINDSIQSPIFYFDGIGEGFGRKMFALSNDSYDPKIFAHELGHCFKLHHPFGTLPQDNKSPEEDFQRNSMSIGSTENIMDYDKNRMYTFWLWQWIIINNNIKYYENR